jgi:LysM repeat protein
MKKIQYRVQSGDSLLAIARRHNLTEDVLSRMNGLSDLNSIQSGQVLQIVQESQSTQRVLTQSRMDRVRANDTPAKMARRNNVTEEALLQANGISASEFPAIGMELQIPPASEPDTANGNQAAKGAEEKSAPSQQAAGKKQAPSPEKKDTGGQPEDSTKARKEPGNPPDPIPGWIDSTGSVLLVIDKITNCAYAIPGSGHAIYPSPEALAKGRHSLGHYAEDLGPLLGLPAVGAGGSRVFRTGPRGALLIDAGSDPFGRVSAGVYLDQLGSTMSRLGVSRLDMLLIIHVHKDHIEKIPDVVLAHGLTADKLLIPMEFLNIPEMKSIITRLRSEARALGYTENWKPGAKFKDRNKGWGDLVVYRYPVGELTVENIGLRDAFRKVATSKDKDAKDAASFLTKITRQSDQAKIVIVGDLRGSHLETIHKAMEVQRAGSWAEFFQDVNTLNGLHHFGAVKNADLKGIQRLLEATYLRNGKLRILEQTHLGAHTQTRTKLLEFLKQIGVEVVSVDKPTVGAAPSMGGASKDQVTASGPHAQSLPTTPSLEREAAQRIQRLHQAVETIEHYQPVFERLNASQKRFLAKELLPQIQQSKAQLQRALGNVILEGLKLLVNNGQGSESAYRAALRRIPTTTQAETALGPTGFAGLARFRDLTAKGVPVEVVLERALKEGIYNPKAFAHMLNAIDPLSRRELLTSSNGKLLRRQVAFNRLKVQYSFQTAVLGTGDISIPIHWSPGARLGGKGLVGFMGVMEFLTAIVIPLLESAEGYERQFHEENVLPFAKRYQLFWQRMGITPKLVGVKDGPFKTVVEERNPLAVISGLNANQWKAFYIEEPGISDEDVEKFKCWMESFILNIEDFIIFFRDSLQDAIEWDNGGAGDGFRDWRTSIWQIKVGRYDTSWINEVEEYWYTHGKIANFMQTYMDRIIINTQSILDEHGRQGALSVETFNRIGSLSFSLDRDFSIQPPLYRAHLTSGLATVPQDPTPVEYGHPFRDVWMNGDTEFTMGQKPKIKWSHPPQFYVYEELGEYLNVGGADVNTYMNLRLLKTIKKTRVHSFQGQYTTTEDALNEGGRVRIHKSLLVKQE